MKPWIFIKKHLEQGHEYLTYMFFFVLSLPDNILPLIIVLWGGSWVLWRVLSVNHRPTFTKSIKVARLFFALFMLINILSSFWGEVPSLAGSILETRLALVIFMIISIDGSLPNLSYKKAIQFYFMGAMVTIILFSLSFLFNYFSDFSFRGQVDAMGLASMIDAYKHPAYLSVNLIISFTLFSLTIKKATKRQLLSLVLSYLVITFIVVVSDSRAGLLSLLMVTLGILAYISKRYLKGLKILMVIVPVFLLSMFYVVNTDKFKDILDTSENVSVKAPRKILWITAYHLAVEKPFIGYGLGSSRVKFIEASQENGIYNARFRKLNTHNQYLEFILESGVFPLIFLLVSIFFFVKDISPYNRHYGIVVVVLFGFALMFESMLLRIAGVSTFTALLLLLMSFKHDKDDNADDKYISWFSFIATLLLCLLICCTWHSRQVSFSPINPESYASKSYSVVDNSLLPGIIPQDLEAANASRFDSTATASLWSGNAYMLNKIESKSLKADEVLSFSTYCYVSLNFDGAWVRASIDRNDGDNFGSSYYDMSKKGTWQKLEVIVENEVGEMPAYHYFSKNNCNSFDDLKGYVLFAYPQYIITKK